ncbi:MAG TPA: serine/threonine-protein kinase [Ktedonosporobacter sp.]|nr:serine/threonine-protein kinase [Ktedonosporobacter sp.]
MNKPAAVQAGQQFGSYRILQPLGRGWLADIYLGEHLQRRNQAAIKVLRVHLGRDDQESFQTEARTIAQLRHPHIVPLLEYGVWESTPFLVMGYAPQGTLRQRYPRGSAQKPITILPAIKQVAAALDYAHQAHILHRDIKPENMLLGPAQEVGLSDFSIVVGNQSSRSQELEEITNSATYMAPEIFRGQANVASDQYALAVVIYEWLCGYAPFHGSFLELSTQHMRTLPPAIRNSFVSPELERVILTALAKDPGQRYPSVSAFITDFEQRALANDATYIIKATPSAPSLQGTGYSTAWNSQSMVGGGQEGAPPGTDPVASQAITPMLAGTSSGVGTPKRRAPLAGLLLALALLLILTELGLAYNQVVLQPAQLHQRQVAGTQTAVTAQQPQNMYTLIMSKKPSIESDLTRPDHANWDQTSLGPHERCSFIGNTYHAMMVAPYPTFAWAYRYCLARNTNALSNFAYQATVTIVEGDEGGLMFRANTASTHEIFYYFLIDQNGSYSLFLQQGNLSQQQPLRHDVSSVIKQGLKQSNVLAVIARDDQIHLFINGHYIISVRDATSLTGSIGVIAFNVRQATDAIFSNVRVWQL